jgi:glycosyltransferase involved in cell wall biosynthesis
MRILFISRWFPYPPDNGSRIRVFNLVKQLSRHHEITLLSFAQGPVSEERLAEMKPYCRHVRTAPHKEFSPNRLKALLGFFSTPPRSIVDTYSREMQTLVEEASTNSSFDVVVASQIGSTPYALLLNQTPRVFEEVELAVIYEQFARQRSLVPRVRCGLTWWKLSRFIAQLLREFRGCTVVSEQEHSLVMGIVPEHKPLTVVPNGVDLEANTGDFGAPEPDTLIYSGALTYSANFDAMEFFLRDIFPLIKAQRPNASLRITGRYDGVPIEQLPPGNGVELTGYLDDIRPVVAQSWGCVVPLQVGGGTRLKILEAMALGTPVVSTSKGAEGLETTHEENILIADDPEDFAQSVLRLLRDENLRARLSANGRRLVEMRYSWEICARQLEQLLHQVVEQRSSSVVQMNDESHNQMHVRP